MVYFYITYSIISILVSLYFKKKKLLANYSGDRHQLYSNEDNIPLIGGLLLVIPILVIDNENFNYLSIIILISLLGIFSDKKILVSPKKDLFLK